MLISQRFLLNLAMPSSGLSCSSEICRTGDKISRSICAGASKLIGKKTTKPDLVQVVLKAEQPCLAHTPNPALEQDESELILRCQQGDRQSFRLLYQRYQQRVRSTLYQLCGSPSLDDLVQEVFFKAWKGLPKLKTPKYFSTWLYRISWNVATDQKRKLAKGRAKKSLSGKFGDEDPLDSLNYGKNQADEQDTPDLMRLHYQDLVHRGLKNLSLDHRAVLVLHDLEDLPQKQIAQVLDIPVGTVKSRLFHARSSLKNFLEQQGISL